MNRLKQQIDFLMEIDKVKAVLRQSVILGDINRRENDAEHSWHMAMCTFVLKDYIELENIDLERVFKMILIHDIIEIYSDDTPAFSNTSKEDKYKKEVEAGKKIFGMLPTEQSKEFFELWLEFENMESNNSKVANVFDRFQGFIQNLSSDGHTWKKWNVTEEMVVRRLEPLIKYAPKLYTDFIRIEIDKYIQKGIIKK